MRTVVLGESARRLWGKSDRADNSRWLPLYVHLSDAGHVAGYLWDQWVPRGTRDVIAKEFGDPDDDRAQHRARQLLVFLASVHDLGKATPVFQSQPTTHAPGHQGESLSDDAHLRLFRMISQGGAGLSCSIDLKTNHPTHAIAGQILLDAYLQKIGFPHVEQDKSLPGQGEGSSAARLYNRLVRQIRESLTCIIGGHHGREPRDTDTTTAEEYPESPYAVAEAWSDEQSDMPVDLAEGPARQMSVADYCAPWRQIRQDLLTWAVRSSGFDFEQPWSHPLSVQSQILLTGLVIMADWIASDQDFFPLVSLEKNGTLVRQHPADDSKPDRDADTMTDGPSCIEKPGTLDLATTEGLDRRAEQAWRALGFEGPWKDPEEHLTAGDLFRQRFDLPEGAQPRPVQKAAYDAVTRAQDPRLLVIEAPMGEGKTEAALAAAEMLARRTGRGGVCVALPTMATTDAMFSRVISWLHHLPTIEEDDDSLSKTVYLAHGNAALNQQFTRIAGLSRQVHEQMRDNPEITSVAEDEENEQHNAGSDTRSAQRARTIRDLSETVVASDWMWGRKKGVLSNFLVCTVDQVLMASLQMKHSVLRDFALANKVVVIDECHAYDSYMRRYLERALEWLGSCGAPVVLLSATLPTVLRAAYVRAYRKGYCAYQAIGLTRKKARSVYQPQDYVVPEGQTARQGYPLITLLDGMAVRSKATKPAGSRAVTVRTSLMGDSQDELLDQVAALVGDGGCLGIICDTVRRAQEAYDTLKNSGRFRTDEIRLLHSRFINVDRMQKENELRTLLGPHSAVVGTHSRKPLRPKRLIVVGTQVLEQSLDIDFDALITDIAPVDLLFQRLGRVHRHHRGEGENERPTRLRAPICRIRGIADWDGDKPLFEPLKEDGNNRQSAASFSGISWNTQQAKGVYPRASLYETLAVTGLMTPDAVAGLELPSDIASEVRRAYDPQCREQLIPKQWREDYQLAARARAVHDAQEGRKAQGFLAASYADLSQHCSTVMQGNKRSANAADEDTMVRAVRDTPEQLSVLVLRAGIENGEKVVRLLPWLGGAHDGLPPVHGGEDGMRIPTDPADTDTGDGLPKDLAKLALQCAVTLPRNGRVPVADLMQAFEKKDGQIVFGWQQDPYLAGQLPLFVDDEGHATLHVTRGDGKVIELVFSYTRERGLEMTILSPETP